MANILNEAFGSGAELTAAINKAPYDLGILARLKLFTEKGISTTEAAIDYEDSQIKIIPTAPPWWRS